MARISTLTALWVLLGLLTANLVSCGKKPEEQTAIQRAKSWLVLIDNEKYAESWKALADIIKKTDTKEDWVADLNRSRKPLGRLLKRDLQHTTKSSEPSVGEYIIFQFKVSFENRKSATEAVSVIKGNDGIWKILGYGII